MAVVTGISWKTSQQKTKHATARSDVVSPFAIFSYQSEKYQLIDQIIAFWSGWGQWSSCVNDQYTRSRTCVDFDEAGVSAKDKFCVGSDEQSVPCTADEVCETEADPQDDGTQP